MKPLRNLGAIAEETGAAVVLIHYAKKMSVDEDMTIDAGRGSNAFLAAVRCQIAVDRPDPKSEWRRVQVLGENLGIAPPPVGFRITDTGLEFGAAPERPKKATEKDSAEAWLRGRMQPGEVYRSVDLLAEAAQHGHAERTVRKAATEKLGIKPRPVREGGHVAAWEWVLPEGGEK